MSSYCTIADVCGAFPQFVNGQTASIQDATIQGWIDDAKARIRSALLTRGFDPDSPPNGPLSADQANFLRALNKDAACADLADAMQGTITMQPGEYNLGAARRASFKAVLAAIKNAEHDALFNTGPLGSIARIVDVQPLFAGSLNNGRHHRRYFRKGDIF